MKFRVVETVIVSHVVTIHVDTCTGKYVRNAETKVLSFYKVSILRFKLFICIAAWVSFVLIDTEIYNYLGLLPLLIWSLSCTRSTVKDEDTAHCHAPQIWSVKYFIETTTNGWTMNTRRYLPCCLTALTTVLCNSHSTCQNSIILSNTYLSLVEVHRARYSEKYPENKVNSSHYSRKEIPWGSSWVLSSSNKVALVSREREKSCRIPLSMSQKSIGDELGFAHPWWNICASSSIQRRGLSLL